MEFIPGTNAYGDLPATEADLFTTAVGERAFIRAFSLFNKSAGSETVTVKIGGRYWRKVVLAVDESAELTGSEVMMLGESDAISGYSTNAASVDYIISTILRV